jgi:hypothetical protein
MRIGSTPDVRQRLLLMLAAAQREPALTRRRKEQPWEPERPEFPRFCNDVVARNKALGLIEEKQAETAAE